MITQSAGVDQRADKLIVTSHSQTTSGVWIDNGCAFVNADTDDTVLGETLRQALSRSELGVPHPSRDALAERQKEWLRARQARSISAYMKGTRSVALHSDDEGHIAVTPTENRGRDGFVEILEARELLPGDIAPAELAAAVRAALEKATDRPR